MKTFKAAGLGIALSVLAASALAAEPAKCCCKDESEKMSCCDKKGDAKPSPAPAQPAQPDEHQQHNH